MWSELFVWIYMKMYLRLWHHDIRKALYSQVSHTEHAVVRAKPNTICRGEVTPAEEEDGEWRSCGFPRHQFAPLAQSPGDAWRMEWLKNRTSFRQTMMCQWTCRVEELTIFCTGWPRCYLCCGGTVYSLHCVNRASFPYTKWDQEAFRTWETWRCTNNCAGFLGNPHQKPSL